MFRNKLSHIDTEKQLFNYFCRNAGWQENCSAYYCAGLYASDTADLFKKLKKAWKEDRKNDTKRILNGEQGVTGLITMRRKSNLEAQRLYNKKEKVAVDEE